MNEKFSVLIAEKIMNNYRDKNEILAAINTDIIFSTCFYTAGKQTGFIKYIFKRSGYGYSYKIRI